MADIKNKIVYQIYPKSFKDSNGDGIGDLRGVIEKLDYLADLGVDYLWLTPFFVSPQKDNGYDVADYLAIDPRFGTMADFDELVQAAAAKGLKIMLDMVLCHTSDQHQWFQRALAGDEKYRQYYILRDGRHKKSEGDPGEPPTNWQCAFGGSAWQWEPRLGKWYLHLHDVSQPDLDWTNPQVREELAKVVRFWKERGVAGFRFDVINLIAKPEIFADDTKGLGRRLFADGPHIHEYLRELVQKAGIDGMMTVGEMASTDLPNCVLYTRPADHELSMAFSFHHLKVDYKDGDKWSLMEPDMAELKRLFADWQTGMAKADGWNALFWCNHDQPRIVSRLGDDKKYRVESAKMLAACIHLMRGTPYIYQGEELGMTNAGYTSIEDYRDVESLNAYRILLEQGKTEDEALKILAARSRDNGRTPMQWSNQKYAGFSTVEPWIPLTKNYTAINVEAAQKNENSILAFYKTLIKLRHEMPIIAEGDIRFIEEDNPHVIAYERAWQGERLTVLCNFRPTSVKLCHATLQDFAGSQKLIGNYPGREERLRPYEVLVFYSRT
ncbi:MAG: alpha,alpha-phosphotrehalase [Selenomonadaceae bacterium]|nr:alpha,alpha-phosphotrehalase [Selenomonadaceae bacterium]